MKQRESSVNAACMGWRLENSYARLPETLFTRQAPVPVEGPRPVRVNAPLARSLGLEPEALSRPEGTALLAGNALPPGSEPISQAYVCRKLPSIPINAAIKRIS